jgi:energy-coupling factor transporter ATP-binding protein EcfA2
MTRLLEINGLTFTYGGAAGPAVSGFDMSVGAGEIVVLAGPSGCGKSTLLRAINGLIPHMYAGAYSGEVLVDGKAVREAQMKELAQKVGFLFQNPENQIFMFSVERDVAFGLENLGVPRTEMRERVDEAMGMLGVGDLARRAPHELSDGQKQRVALAGVMAMRPKLVILDEPTSLLDPMTAAELVALVDRMRKAEGTTFIVVEHRLELLARVADRLVVMDGGEKVMEGRPADIFADPAAPSHGVAIPAVAALGRGLAGEGSVPSPEELAALVEGSG